MIINLRDENKALEMKHRDEEITLGEEFRKEVEDEQRSLASLKQTWDRAETQHLEFDKQEADKANSLIDSCTLEAVRGTLECPICLEIMKPPTRIWMCPLSHIICEPCKGKLKGGGLCPTCTSEKVTLRAFMAENFARTVFNH